MNDGKNNRGAHGDSLRMLDEVSSSNKNPPTSVVRKAKKNDNHAAAQFMVPFGPGTVERYGEAVG